MTQRDPLVQGVSDIASGLSKTASQIGGGALIGAIGLAYFALAWACGLNYPSDGYWTLGLPDRVWAFLLLGSLPWLMPDTRRWILATLAARRLRKRWDVAMVELGLVNDAGKAPRISDTSITRVADRGRFLGLLPWFAVRYDVIFTLRLPVGHSIKDDLAPRAERFATALRVKTARVEPIPDKPADYAQLVVLRHEPFRAKDRPARWPHRRDRQRSLWDPIAVGRDEQGKPFMLELFERNVMVAGQPGGGKSVFLGILTAAAALDPRAHLHLMDGKGGIELEPWACCATTFVDEDADKAVELLTALSLGTQQRYQAMRVANAQETARAAEARAHLQRHPGPWTHRLGRRARDWLAPALEDRKLPPALKRLMRDSTVAVISHKVSPPTSLHLLVVDELPTYIASSRGAEITELLIYLVRHGRAAGVIVVAGAQKPEGQQVPTNLRDLFTVRVSFAATSPAASDVALGQGWASRGYNAALIDLKTPGVCFLLGEGGIPVRLRTYFLADDEVPMLAERGAALRGRTRSEAPEPEDVIDVEAVEVEDYDESAKGRPEPAVRACHTDAPRTATLVIDALPPGKNGDKGEDWSNSQGNAPKAGLFREHRREWKALVTEAAEKAELPKECEHIACTATFRFEKANRRDPQNFWHNVGVIVPDALVEAGYLPDDTQEHWTPNAATIQRGTGKPRTTLELAYRVRAKVPA